MIKQKTLILEKGKTRKIYFSHLTNFNSTLRAEVFVALIFGILTINHENKFR